METIFIISPELMYIRDAESWAQGLIGNVVPDNEDYIAEKVIQFQLFRVEQSQRWPGNDAWRLAVLLAVSEAS